MPAAAERRAAGDRGAARTAADDALIDAVLDQHARLRSLLQAAAHAPEVERDDACAGVLRHLAVHLVAEAVALDGSPGTPRARREARALTAVVERLDDLGTARPSYRVQLGLLAAEVAHHVRASEVEVLPRFVATRDEEEVLRAVEVLRDAEPLATDPAPDAPVPAAASFVHQLRAAREAITTAASASPARPGVGDAPTG